MAGKRRTEKAGPGNLSPKFTHLTSLSTFFTSLILNPVASLQQDPETHLVPFHTPIVDGNSASLEYT